MRLRPFFSFYGAKWRASNYYQPPAYDTIVEPFAGSACYALRYFQKQVILVDADPDIAGLWQWLIDVPEKEIAALPEDIEDLDSIDLPSPAKTLIGFWFVKGSAVAVRRPYAWARTGKWSNQFWGADIKARICSQIKYIRHWRVINASYKDAVLPEEATWFIDPPYQVAGKHYRYNNINYTDLGCWCRTRRGQVIVCEQQGADWLPFEKFKDIKALKSRITSEVVYYQGDHGLLI